MFGALRDYTRIRLPQQPESNGQTRHPPTTCMIAKPVAAPGRADAKLDDQMPNSLLSHIELQLTLDQATNVIYRAYGARHERTAQVS